MKSLKYLSDTYLEKFTVKITKVIEMDGAVAVYCDNTIFYPQGGGQPCDLGVFIIDGCAHQVYHTETTVEGISHMLKSHPSLLTCTGKQCIQHIDIQRRLFNAKLHTAGHLISHIVETLDHNLSPVKGHHYPNGSYIEMIESKKTNDTFLVEWINEKIDAFVDTSPRKIQSFELDLAEVKSLRPLLSPFIPQSTRIRMIAVDGFTPVPCGGTHVNCTSKLKGLRVTRIKRKKNRIKVSYLIN
ncbi:metal-dependent hydrolase [Psychromonas sp. CNPT3]|uniref:alanyl-tRNA editing protein n=1 Tax=Psychromonas sp. CNPT3 TaxID=314282 RepID=UPI00006E891E|nr:alanyl-tRNA editing protein [Psychromonas sp. CNPT3]AGH82412.1 metal-dependent hydrolase [Psychromonas sp. CNPT3]